MFRIAFLVLCASLIIPGTVWAQGEGGTETRSAPPVTQAVALDEEVTLDPYAVKYREARESGSPRGYADTYIIDDIVLGLSMFGGISKSWDRGHEESFTSMWGGAVASGRVHAFDFNLGQPVRVELGLAIKGMSGHFRSSTGPHYKSVWQTVNVSGEIVLRHDPANQLALWSLMLRPGIQYTRTEGKSSRTGYENIDEVTHLTLEAQLDLYWPFDIKPDGEYWTNVRGAPVNVRIGWLPKLSFWGEYQQQIHLSRRSSVTRAGGSDRAHQNRGTIRGSLYLYRFANFTKDTDQQWLWEVSPYVLGGLTVVEANGYNIVKDGSQAYISFVGVGVEVVLNRFASLIVEGQAWFEMDGIGRNGGALQVGFNIWGW